MFRLLLAVLAPCLAVLLILVPGMRSVPSVSAQGQAPREPLDYFREMVPVFTHDRCINCHGAVDPFTNRDHDGGLIDPGQSCTASGCHEQADGWRLAPAAVWFVKLAGNQFVTKDDKELCNQMADRVANFSIQDFMDHLQNDHLIDLGFLGLSGVVNAQGDPPPMIKPKFLVAAARWMDDGFAACDREGTIIHTEEINSDRTYDAGTVQELRVKQSGRREVTVEFANGRYETRVQVKGSVTMTQTVRGEVNGVPCTTVITSTTDYADVDDPAPRRLVAGAASNVGQTGSASVEVKLEANGEYTVTVRLGEEKHRQVESASLQDGCGTVLRPSPTETLEQVWPGTAFVFRGKLPNPRDRTRLVGRELKVWFERLPDSPDEDPWLPDHYAAAAQDGHSTQWISRPPGTSGTGRESSLGGVQHSPRLAVGVQPAAVVGHTSG